MATDAEMSALEAELAEVRATLLETDQALHVMQHNYEQMRQAIARYLVSERQNIRLLLEAIDSHRRRSTP